MGTRWTSADLGKKKPAGSTKPRSAHKDADQPKRSEQREEKPPAEKHVRLPPPPPECGPWPVGPWELRRTVTYEPQARVVLTGPAEDFDKLLTYLQAYQP